MTFDGMSPKKDAEQSLDGQWLIGAALKEVTFWRESTRLSQTADERGEEKKGDCGTIPSPTPVCILPSRRDAK